jgi:Winged helix DNA-binding domain
VRRISDEQRRARLGLWHRLALRSRTGSVAEIAYSLVGIHSSDPVTVFLSARARNPALTISEIEDSLYKERSVVRVLGMRRTMFVVSREDVQLLVWGCAEPMVRAETTRLEKMLLEAGISDDPGPWLKQVMEETLMAIRERGEAAATELTKSVPDLSHQISFGEGRRWAGTVGVSTRVLFLLATNARIVRSRPRGSWISGQYRWSAFEDWLGNPLPPLDRDQARADLVRRWLTQYGPGTLTDLKWWTGWPVTAVRKALEQVAPVVVSLSSGSGYMLSDEDLPADPPPWAAFLPGLDSTVMGWKERDWYLGTLGPQLFDTNGNAGPTVWWQGRVVGGWGQRRSGEVAYRLLDDIGADAARQIETEAGALENWLGQTSITPRFRTPMEKEIGT